jgi:hypothetical protein
MKNEINAVAQAAAAFPVNRLFLFLLLLFLSGASLRAQDVLTLMNGTEIKAKVLEINDTEVRYRNFGDNDGPVRTVSKSELFMIRYESGTREVFDAGSGPASTTQAVPANGKATAANATPYQKFGGPRLGYTFITEGTLTEKLARAGKQPSITQFGWQFEKRLFSFDDGPSGMIEFVPLIGGMEQGLFLPSASLLIGLRAAGEQPLELAFGPNLSVSGLGVVIALGRNFRYKNVNFPVNIAYVPSVSSIRYNYDMAGNEVKQTVHTGHRISLVVGFNVRKK